MKTSTDPRPSPPPGGLEHHPAAALFPLLEVQSQEFGEGLLPPIVLHDGRILDGRNRYRACQRAGIEPRFVEWDGESPTAFVISLNVHRRHLTDGQKAMIALDALPLFEAEAERRRREAGREAPGLGRWCDAHATCTPSSSHWNRNGWSCRPPSGSRSRP